MAKRWTQEEDDLLLKLRTEGYTSREMTLYLKERTHAAIRTRLVVIAPDNLNRTWTEAEKLQALELQAEQKSNKYIARVLNRTPRAIASFLSRHWNSVAREPSAEKD